MSLGRVELNGRGLALYVPGPGFDPHTGGKDEGERGGERNASLKVDHTTMETINVCVHSFNSQYIYSQTKEAMQIYFRLGSNLRVSQYYVSGKVLHAHQHRAPMYCTQSSQGLKLFRPIGSIICWKQVLHVGIASVSVSIF